MSDLDLATKVLDAQPFSALIGARVTVFSPGAATLEIDVEDRLRQQFGLLHGGVLAYAADNALTFAGGSVLGPSVVTAGMSIHYLRAVREGVLRAEATVVHHNADHAICTARLLAVHGEDEPRLVAIADGTIRATGDRP